MKKLLTGIFTAALIVGVKSQERVKFDNASRNFNDWAISVGSGTALMQSADLTSFYGGKITGGWNAYVSLDKQINHTFGLQLQYQTGETRQRGMAKPEWGEGSASTKFQNAAILGDVNFSNLMRKNTPSHRFRTALHGYAGIGFMGYETKLTDNIKRRYPLEINQDFGIASFFYQAGGGLKFKLSRILDLEARAMYVVTGDEEFDGGGWESDVFDSSPRKSLYPYNFIKKNTSDNFFTANLGLSFKLGKHLEHLAWADGLEDVYQRLKAVEAEEFEAFPCKSGDSDRDGVCDDWDRQIDTPMGARVDGSGVALDVDFDGVIDLYDECVTVPGEIIYNGCPQKSGN